MLEFWNVSREMSHRCTQRLERDHLIRRVKMSWSDMPDWFYLYDEKRPDQIQHRLGKSWIYTAWHMKALDSYGVQSLTYFKSENRKFYDKDKSHPIPDCYGVMNHKVYGNIFSFGEFQVNSSSNTWNKDYRSLFDTFALDQYLSLMVVTTDSFDTIKAKMYSELLGKKNIRLEFYTLDKLRDLCWRIVLIKREEHRQKELT